MTKLFSRFDSWLSTLTGIGEPYRDKTMSFHSRIDMPLDVGTIESLMTGDDLAYRIAASLPSTALKDGFGFAISDDGEVEPGEAQGDLSELASACRKFQVRERVCAAGTWGQGYGLAGIMLGVKGAGAPDVPLDDDNPRGKLMSLTVIDRREMLPESYYDDPLSDKLGEVEYYNIQPSNYTGMSTIRVHESRIIRFGGAMTPRRERQRNAGCDYSVFQRIYPVLRQVNQNWASLCALMADMSQGVYKINGLSDMIASGNEEALQTRMGFLDMARSVSRSIILDTENEDFERKATPMEGVNEVIEQGWTRLCAAAERPKTVLFGTSPAGLNATGESDMRLWYDRVQAYREYELVPAIERIARYIARDLGHVTPDSWIVTFPSLWRMTASEQALYRFQCAQADGVYIDKKVLLPSEVALSRFASGDEFDGSTTTIDVKARVAELKMAAKALADGPPEQSASGAEPDGKPGVDRQAVQVNDPMPVKT